MPARIEGYITVDVADCSDELEINCDAEDIVELMDQNCISIEEMMDLFDVKKADDNEIKDVYLFLESADAEALSAVASKCIDLIHSEYIQAEEGRQVYMQRVVKLKQDIAEQTFTAPVRQIREEVL